MRYRLRTLLILMTVVCACLAWVGYCRRMAAFHRERSSQLISQVAKREGMTHKQVEEAMSELFERWPIQAVEMAQAAPTGTDRYEPVYCSAIDHETIARKYDRAVWWPWILISN
jgi:hypothetical protein